MCLCYDKSLTRKKKNQRIFLLQPYSMNTIHEFVLMNFHRIQPLPMCKMLMRWWDWHLTLLMLNLTVIYLFIFHKFQIYVGTCTRRAENVMVKQMRCDAYKFWCAMCQWCGLSVNRHHTEIEENELELIAIRSARNNIYIAIYLILNDDREEGDVCAHFYHHLPISQETKSTIKFYH